MRGWAATCWAPMVTVAGRRGPEDLENLVDAQPGACLGLAGDGQGGEHDGQVSLDAVFEAVEHGPGGQIRLGHPETSRTGSRPHERHRNDSNETLTPMLSGCGSDPSC
jgi:hypothetical protein